MEDKGLIQRLFVNKSFNSFLFIAWRCNIVFFILAFAIAPFANSTTSMGRSLFIALLIACVPIAFSVLVLWIFMLAHLFIIQNANILYKAIWAVILVLGLQSGAYFYFGFVYRRETHG